MSNPYPYRLREIEGLPKSDTYSIKIFSSGEVGDPDATKHLRITPAELSAIADVVREDGRGDRYDTADVHTGRAQEVWDLMYRLNAESGHASALSPYIRESDHTVGPRAGRPMYYKALCLALDDALANLCGGDPARADDVRTHLLDCGSVAEAFAHCQRSVWGDSCDECGQFTSETRTEVVNGDHDAACSLHPDNVTGGV